MVDRQTTLIQIDQRVWSSFKLLCKANKLTVNSALESVIRAALERHGIPLIEERERRGLAMIANEGSVR